MKYNTRPSIIIIAILLVTAFFLPWFVWNDRTITGHALASGNFFDISTEQLGLVNPFPKLAILFYSFWLIPVLGLAIIAMEATGKRIDALYIFTGFLALVQVAVYYQFTSFGIGRSAFHVVRLGAALETLSAIALIIFTPVRLWIRLLALLAAPALVIISFKLTEDYIMSETHNATSNVKADYTLSAEALIKEFITNDTAARKKYTEKMIEVSGPATAIQLLADSTSTIRFGDSTASYAIFSLEKTELNKAAAIQPGTTVTIKGVCSGSIYSDILSTTSISFKRSVLVK